MSASLVQRLPDGGYMVSRVFSSKSAAFAGVDRLLSVVESAYVPVMPDIPLAPAAEIQIAKAENED
jgi:hypothetical protein